MRLESGTGPKFLDARFFVPVQPGFGIGSYARTHKAGP